MFKRLLILAAGIVIGYFYGWDDAQVNDQQIAERVIDQIGGKTRDAMRNDVDTKFRALEK